MVTWEEYSLGAARTIPADPTDDERRLVNFALGVAGEAGEVADLIKKHVFHQHDLDPERLIEELGDVLWYVAALARTLDVALEDVARQNLAKLRRRYPAGFDAARSRTRPEAR